MTDDDQGAGSETAGAPLRIPPDPSAYDTERNAAARRRGLSTPYIPGGRDPDAVTTEREERRLVRILVLMVVVVVLAGFVLGFIAAIVGLDSLVGGSG